MSNTVEEQQKQQEPAQQQQEQQQEQEPTPTTITQEDLEVTNSEVAKHFKSLIQGFKDDYDKQIISMMEQDTFSITLNKLDPTGKKETIDMGDEKIELPVYDGTEDKSYKHYPLSPRDFATYRKLQLKFDNEQDPDKVPDNQLNLYKFLSACFFKMPQSEFDRVNNWVQLKKAVEACVYKTIYKPGK